MRKNALRKSDCYSIDIIQFQQIPAETTYRFDPNQSSNYAAVITLVPHQAKRSGLELVNATLLDPQFLSSAVDTMGERRNTFNAMNV